MYLYIFEIASPRGFGELWAQGHLKEIEPDFLMTWFANYWAAVNDPLQTEIDSLKIENEGLQMEINNLKCE